MGQQLTLPLEPHKSPAMYTHIDHRAAASGSRGATFRYLLQRILNERSRSLQYGWCKLNPAAVRLRMVPVEQWILDHPSFISDAQVRACWDSHTATIAFLAPATNTGRRLFLQLQEIASEC